MKRSVHKSSWETSDGKLRPCAHLSLQALRDTRRPGGVVQWKWFFDPLNESLKGIPANREHLGQIIRAILDRQYPGTDQQFEGNALLWEPISLGEDVEVGFIWTASGPLVIGVGSKADFTIASQNITALLLARLIEISEAGSLSGKFGQIRFGGAIPVPDFLTSATLVGDTQPSFQIALTVVDKDNPVRTRALSTQSPVIAWDAARLATLSCRHSSASRLQDRHRAAFLRRVDDHLFPMLGEPEAPPNNPVIRSFPLVGDTMGQPFNLNNWKDSVFTTNNNASGALTFLWHLRALLTGNESPDFFSSSFHFPLIGGAVSGAPPTLANAQTPYAPGPNSAWFSMTTANNVFTLSLDLFDAAGTACPPIILGTVNAQGQFSRPQLSAATLTTIATFLNAWKPRQPPLTIGGGEYFGDTGRKLVACRAPPRQHCELAIAGIQWRLRGPSLPLSQPADRL